MSSLLSNLTATALLVHALMGCCWHHAHQCQHALAAAEHGGPAVACHEDGDCDGHARPPAPAGEERHGDDGCQSAPCAFVATQPDSTAVELLVEHHDTAAVAATIAAENAEVCYGRTSPSLSEGDCLALRQHLLSRVLLI